MAAITLGIVGPKAFARRVGRNEAFNHAGNAIAATHRRITAYFFGPVVVFWLMAAMAAASILPRCRSRRLRSTTISRAGSTAMAPGTTRQPSGFQVLLRRPLLIFAASRRCSTSPTPPCCRWSGRSWRSSTAISAPR